MTTRYPNALPARIMAYFAANPEEELTHADLRAKFDAKDKTSRCAVESLCRGGHLESGHVIRLPAKGRMS